MPIPTPQLMNTVYRNNNCGHADGVILPTEDLTLWLDASDTDSLTITNSKISAINDLSGNDNHAFQESSSRNPLQVVNSNGGVGIDFYTASMRLNLPTLGDIGTLFAVMQFDETISVASGNTGTMIRDKVNSDSIRVGTGTASLTDEIIYVVAETGSGRSGYVHATEELTADELYVIAMTYNADSGGYDFQINGGVKTTQTNDHTMLQLPNDSYWPHAMATVISEYAVYSSSMTVQEITSISSKLMAKWGVS